MQATLLRTPHSTKHFRTFLFKWLYLSQYWNYLDDLDINGKLITDSRRYIGFNQGQSTSSSQIKGRNSNYALIYLARIVVEIIFVYAIVLSQMQILIVEKMKNIHEILRPQS